MIKRYILHIEAHKRHLPRISFKRAPRPGDRVVDGGVPGTLVPCNFCSTTGFLHKPDPRPRFSMPKPLSKTSALEGFIAELAKSIAQGRAQRTRPTRSYHTPRPAMDWNVPQHVELKIKDEKPAAPVEHVELKVTEQDPILKLEFEHGSPETLKLDYTLGTRKYKPGEVVWTHKANYVVERLTKKVLYLVRKDVWDARKKAEHVELKVTDEKPVEHVELKFGDDTPEEETSGGVVELKFE